MNDKVPCCMADAARKVKKLDIGGILVGISQLDQVIQEVIELRLEDEKKIKRELLYRVKIYNYVSSNVEDDYTNALYKEYKRQALI